MFERFPVTIALCLMVASTFLVQQILGGTMDPETLVRMGALRPDRLFEFGEVYRLFTSMFLHVGPIHVILNGIALFQLVLITEWLYGSVRTLAFYLICGLVGAVGSAAMMVPYLAGSVGASGAIMGLAGLIFGLQLYGETTTRERLNEMIAHRLAAGIALTFAVGILLAVFFMPIIDNYCHAAGFFTGMLLAFIYPDPNSEPEYVDIGAAVVLTGLVLGSFGWAAADGEEALETFHIDAAESFRHRLEDRHDGYVAAGLIGGVIESYREAGAPNTGIEVLEGLLDRCESADTTSTVAGLIFEEGWDTETEMVLDRWLELTPDDPVALNAYAWLLVTRQDEEARDPAKALPVSERSLEIAAAGEDEELYLAGFLDTKGEILLQLDRIDEALEVQTEAVRLERARNVGLSERFARVVGLVGPPMLEELEKRLVVIEERIEAEQ